MGDMPICNLYQFVGIPKLLFCAIWDIILRADNIQEVEQSNCHESNARHARTCEYDSNIQQHKWARLSLGLVPCMICREFISGAAAGLSRFETFSSGK
jgi:hypothetical protein